MLLPSSGYEFPVYPTTVTHDQRRRADSMSERARTPPLLTENPIGSEGDHVISENITKWSHGLRYLFLVNLLTIASPIAVSVAFEAENRNAPSCATPVNRKSGQFSLDYIPASSVMIIVAYPARMLSSPEVELLPIELLQAAWQERVGVDVLQVEQAICLLGKPTTGQETPYGFVLRFREPYAKRLVLRQLGRAHDDVAVAGKNFLRARTNRYPSIFFADDRTLVLGTNQFFEEMIASQNANSTLLALLKATTFQHDLNVLATTETLRDVMSQAKQQLRLPAPFDELLGLADHITTLRLGSTFSGLEIVAHAECVCASDDAALKVEGALRAVLTASVKLLDATFQQALERNSHPNQKAAVRYLVRMAAKAESLFQPTRLGNVVQCEFKGDVSVVATGLVGIMSLPMGQAFQNSSRFSKTLKDFKQIGVAMQKYHEEHGTFPPHASFDKEGRALLSWRVLLLPYLGEEALYKAFRLDEPWDSAHNEKLIAKIPDVYRMPDLFGAPRVPLAEGVTYLVVPSGIGTVFDGSRGMSMQDIVDGPSRTILVVEVEEDGVVLWTEPDDLQYDPQNPGRKLLDNLGRGGFGAICADGNFRYIDGRTDPESLKALFSPAGGESVPLFQGQPAEDGYRR